MFRVNKFIISFLGLLASAAALNAAEVAVSPSPYKLTEIFGLPLTNTILTTWAVSILFIVVIRLTVGKPKLIPGKGQAVIENLVAGLQELFEPILGKKAFGMVFPLLIGFFVFILIHNWSGLIPGVGAFGHYDDHGHFKYWMRPANSDLNATLGMALIATVPALRERLARLRLGL